MTKTIKTCIVLSLMFAVVSCGFHGIGVRTKKDVFDELAIEVGALVASRVISAVSLDDEKTLFVVIDGADASVVLKHVKGSNISNLLKVGENYKIEGRRLVDKETGYPCSALVFVISVQSPESATVRVLWNGSWLQSSETSYVLVKVRDDWVIKERKRGAVS